MYKGKKRRKGREKERKKKARALTIWGGRGTIVNTTQRGDT